MVDPAVPVELVHASRGKRTRAEPVAALYEQGRVHHVGALPELEDQLCLWEATSGEPSPDRLDALVWAVSELVVNSGPPLTLISGGDTQDETDTRSWFQDLLRDRMGK